MQTVFVGPPPRLAVSVAGDGELVLFLHGIGGRRQNWQAQLAFFSREYKAAAWDARGYGESDDYDGPLDFRVFSADLLRVLDHFEAPRAHIVGLSMGGRIARNFALHHPGRLRSLTLANTSPGFGALTQEAVQRFVAERRELQPELQAKRVLGRNAPREAFDALVASMRALRRESYLKTVEASVSQDLAAPLEEIRAPTLVIASRHDPLYPPSISEDMARRIPGARLVIIEDAGHLSNLERPDEFNRALDEFLRERSLK
ncbi:MAG: alpha/beta fold hydrolase [Burkholderiales bacterium]